MNRIKRKNGGREGGKGRRERGGEDGVCFCAGRSANRDFNSFLKTRKGTRFLDWIEAYLARVSVTTFLITLSINFN